MNVDRKKVISWIGLLNWCGGKVSGKDNNVNYILTSIADEMEKLLKKGNGNE